MKPMGKRHGDRPNTGPYRDGLGNLIDVVAVANPPIRKTASSRLQRGVQRSSGFGVVRMNKRKGTIVAEAWPVGVDASESQSQYPGWPITVTVSDCAGSGNPALPPVVLRGWGDRPLPVVEVRDSRDRLVSIVRMTQTTLQPRVFDARGVYLVNVILPESNGGHAVKRFRGVSTRQSQDLIVEPDD
jgi:alkaline phosphatase D